MLLFEQILALLSSSKSHYTTKLAALTLARIRLILYNSECEWEDLPSDAYLEYIQDDAIWMEVLVSGARENKCNRKAKETIDRVTTSIVEETKKEKDKK